MRLIDADELHETISRWLDDGNYNFETRNALRCALYEIKTAPTASPSVVTMKLKVSAEDVKKAMQDAELTLMPAEKKGKWIGIDDEPCEVWECDKCGHIVECDATLALPNYCENCGARMEGESDGVDTSK